MKRRIFIAGCLTGFATVGQVWAADIAPLVDQLKAGLKARSLPNTFLSNELLHW